MRRYSQESAAPSSAQPIVIHWLLSCSGMATVANASDGAATTREASEIALAGRLDAQQLAQEQRHHHAFGHRNDPDVRLQAALQRARFAPRKRRRRCPAPP